MTTLFECPLNLSEATLSAYRDALLPVDEGRRIAAHVRECAACRARLAGFERLARPLRAERAPEPDERLWLAIRAGMAGAPQRMGSRGRRDGPRGWDGQGGPSRRTWGTLAAIAAVVLLAVGFASLFGVLLPNRGPTGKPTPTIQPRVSPTTTRTTSTGPIQWQTITWPRGQSGPSSEDTYPSSAPSDGNTAYLCVAPSSATANEQIWVTHNFAAPNHGAQWSHTGDLPIAHQDVNTCGMEVDMNNPAVLLAIVGPQTGATDRDFASLDGGATWREIAQQPLYFSGSFLGGLASYQGKVYALAATTSPNPPRLDDVTIRVSSDQMQTWQPIPTANRFDSFWLNANGELLAHDANSRQFVFSDITGSDGGGKTWHAFQNPSSFDTYAYVVAAPVAGQSWVVCGLTLPSGASSSQGPMHTAVCTQDLGKAYTTLPNLPNTPANANDPAGDISLIGITSDGSVLATLGALGIPKTQPSSTGYPLWRLPPGGRQWQSLGIPPQFNVGYTPGALVASPDAAVPVRSCATCAVDQSDYVAAYPET
jgi:hypothetical protein